MKKETIINTLVLNGPLIYFSIFALLGYRADPEEGAGITYKIYMVTILLLGFFLWFKGFVKGRNRRMLPLIILSLYILVGVLQEYTGHRLFLQMVCFSVPATCIALNMKGRGELAEVMKLMDLLLPVFAVSFIFMVRNIYASRLENLGSYNQNASYMIAYCFLIDIFLLLNKENYPKFRFLDNKWYTTFKIILLPYFVVLSFFGGGRGAFITILVGSFLGYWLNRKKISFKMIIKVGLVLLISVFLLLVVLNKLSDGFATLLADNFERITSLVDNGSINTSASSGRDEIWKDAWKLISDKPVLGYGLFSYLSRIMWPHNIFLEVLLQGGVFLLFSLIVVLLLSLSKYRKMLKCDRSQIWLVPLIIHVFTQLLFSGSYMFETYFWFSLSYIYTYRFKRNTLVLNHLNMNNSK